jgi:hypothetical protein
VLTLFIVWASGLITGFALLFWAEGSRLGGMPGMSGFAADLYMSGTTFFTLGLGDLHPLTPIARLTTVVEAGTGFGFLALVIAYVPVLYQAFSRREARITMLDEWAGSPPSAAVLLRRWSESKDPRVLEPLLKDWELAAAEILESHLSYPILCFFRSQHDNQSWLASLTAFLDTCALVIVGVDGIEPFQARLTFAIGRHAMDLSRRCARSGRARGGTGIGSAERSSARLARALGGSDGRRPRRRTQADGAARAVPALRPAALPAAAHAARPGPAAGQSALQLGDFGLGQDRPGRRALRRPPNLPPRSTVEVHVP